MSNFQVSEDFLLDDAYRKVWCTPEQDKQAIFELARITPENGVWTYLNFQNRKIHLPETGNGARFHIYQVGQVHPKILGLLHRPNQWIPAKLAMQQESVLMDIYNGKGIMIPRCLCWYIVTGDKNLLVAIRKPVDRPLVLIDCNLETEPVFMRLYSNAYFNVANNGVIGSNIKVNSIKSDTVAAINAFQSEIAALPTTGGKFFYVNGRRVNKIDLVSAKVGDYLDYCHDASVKREVFFKVSSLQEFESQLDTLHKYLLHYAGSSDLIDYQDDVDVYVGYTYQTNRWTGAYVHKNDSRTLRMVTHRDYSIPVIRVAGTKAANPFLIGKDLEVRLTIRHSGYSRPLVNEHHRIAELYKLPADRIEKAMVGMDSTVSVWEASSLEDSAYTAIMSAPQGTLTRETVQAAYGYNAMSLLFGDTPKRVTPFSGQKVIEIPKGLIGCATVYEYSAIGQLLFFSVQTLDNTYSCQAADAAFVEVIYGEGGVELDMVDAVLTGTINPRHNYRFYAAQGIGATMTSQWLDVSGDAYYTLDENNVYTWVESASAFRRVLSNRKHLAYSFDAAPIAGVFTFDITVLMDGTYKRLDIPLGELDIFYNGYSLIENLDYKIIGSRVVVSCKKYYNEALAQQRFTVRYTGFCKKDMTRDSPEDLGFIFHGNLSANDKYDVREDRVLRIVAGGRVRLRDELDFAEDGVEINIDDVENGTPYSIRDIIVPMNHYLVGGDPVDKTYVYREQSRQIDAEVGDYLTEFLPVNRTTFPNVIPNRYVLYSPFLSRIIDDLKSGVLWDDKFEEHFGDDWLRTRLASYLPLLAFDAIGTGFEIDTRYVVVHPHPYPTYISLNIYQWRVISRVAAIYAPEIDLSSSINVLQF